ncbi:Protein kinase domain [Sesbania bispinosa]|nr:Protein kinase domain [Sesbania bispinosa]
MACRLRSRPVIASPQLKGILVTAEGCPFSCPFLLLAEKINFSVGPTHFFISACQTRLIQCSLAFLSQPFLFKQTKVKVEKIKACNGMDFTNISEAETEMMEIITDSDSDAAIWKEIEVSESYLVCSMYEEAASLASSILKLLRDDYDAKDIATQDMLESTAMVLVQALKELGRTPEILDQLRLYFISVKAIPAQVLLTGACFQIAEGSAFGVQELLEEFLNGWSLVDAKDDIVIAEANTDHESRYERHFVLGIDKYLETVELYAITLLATVLKDVDRAISWVENASLPEGDRQGLLRRLHSMHSLRSTILSQIPSTQSPTNNNEAYSLKELNACEGSPEALKDKHTDNRKYRSKGVSKLSERIETCFWCFRSINLKFGTAKFAISSGKIMLGCLILLIYYFSRKKQATLTRIVRRQVTATKRALVDLWQLAFSYQLCAIHEEVNQVLVVYCKLGGLVKRSKGKYGYGFGDLRIIPFTLPGHGGLQGSTPGQQASFVLSETEMLLKFRESLENNNALSAWNASTPPCTDDHANWKGILCYKGHIWGLKLEKMGLKGVIDVSSLKDLPYLRTISVMNNDFDSEWPEFNMLVGLKTIYLSNNKFSGEIPSQAFQGMQWLKKIHLSHNQFSGPIPSSVAMLPRLMELRLEGNQFTGSIPKFHQTLKSFSVANNQLEGEIPASLSKLPASAFSGNEDLCGGPISACSSKKSKTVTIVVAVVLVIVALIVIGAVILLILRRRRKQASEVSTENRPTSLQKTGGVSEEGSHRSSRSQGSTRSSSRKGDNMKLSFVRDDREHFDLQELLRASAEILGSGCFSSSYKAALINGPSVVVKRFKQMNNVGREEFQEHMRRLGRLSHPNLLPLVSYYYRKEEKLLIGDFVQNGSLAAHLHGHQSIGEPSLDWPSRLKIVKGVAKGLEYLYKEMPSLITPHGHLKSSNVLLSENLEPILNDYGLVPVINQDLAPDIMVIYKSPEYLQHGRVTKKTDVWSLGILILEILTGKFPANFLPQGKASELSLATWVESIVPENWSSEVFDKEMGATKNSEGEMVKLLRIALNCCEGDVDKRWDLKEAVDKIQEVKERDNDEDFASEADMKSKDSSGEVSFSING